MTKAATRDTTLTCADCLYNTPLTTAAMAAYTIARHSCAQQRTRDARAARVIARQQRSGPRRHCKHKRAHHLHGTRSAYVLDRCRCKPCRLAATAAESERRRQIAYGRWQPYVDAQPARDHIETLRVAGMGAKLIARHAGLAHGAMAKLIYGDHKRAMGPSKRIRRETETKILSVTVTPDRLGARTAIDATGSHRRVRALVWLGWSQSEIGRRVGMAPANFGKIMANPTIGARSACLIRDLYDQMHNERPPERTKQERCSVSRARNYARAHDWKPPMWWGDDIDDPTAEQTEDLAIEAGLDEVAVRRALNGEPTDLTREERDEVTRILRERGVSASDAARRLGSYPRKIQRDLDRLGLTQKRATA